MSKEALKKYGKQAEEPCDTCRDTKRVNYHQGWPYPVHESIIPSEPCPKCQAKKPKCKRCGGSGEVPKPPKLGGGFSSGMTTFPDQYIPCPDCQTTEPEASELTKPIRRAMVDFLNIYGKKSEIFPPIGAEQVIELCDIIDSLTTKPDANEFTKKLRKEYELIWKERECTFAKDILEAADIIDSLTAEIKKYEQAVKEMKQILEEKKDAE